MFKGQLFKLGVSLVNIAALIQTIVDIDIRFNGLNLGHMWKVYSAIQL